MSDLLLTARARQIIAEVAARHYCNPRDLENSGRELVTLRARQVAMYALRKGLHLSFPMIGRLLHRDHTTVIHAVAVVEANPELRVEAWRIIGTMPIEKPIELSDAELRRFVTELDEKIAIATTLRSMLASHLPVSA